MNGPMNLGLGHMSLRAAMQLHPPDDITICVGVASSGLPTREGTYGIRADVHTTATTTAAPSPAAGERNRDDAEASGRGSGRPRQRAGRPEEVAPSYVFLASEDASSMAGQILHPNGGEVVNG